MNLWQWFTDPANWNGPNGIPVRFAQQVVISAIAMGIAVVIAIPIGVILGHFGRGGFLAVNISNVGRAIPTFGLLVIFASWTPIGVGDKAAILALVIFAIPPLLTNAYVGVSGVDVELREAATGMGMGAAQVLLQAELPNCVPLIAAGIRTATVQVVATASLAAMVGGGGLGAYVVEGFAVQNFTLLIAGAILTAVLALATEAVLAGLQRLVTPRGLRDRERAAEMAAAT